MLLPNDEVSKEEWLWALARARLILGIATPEEALAQVLEENGQEHVEVTEIVAVEPLVHEDKET